MQNNHYEYAQHFFSLAPNRDPDRSIEDEEKLLTRIYSTYEDKDKFLEHLNLFLVNHKQQYKNSYGKDLMLHDFLSNKFPQDKVNDSLKKISNKNFTVSDGEDIFDNYNAKIEIIILDQQKFFNSLCFKNIKSSAISTASHRIESYAFDCINDYFKHKGLLNCLRNYTADEDKHIYYAHLEPSSTITKQDICQFFIDVSHFLTDNHTMLDSKENTRDILEEFKKIYNAKTLNETLPKKQHLKISKI